MYISIGVGLLWFEDLLFGGVGGVFFSGANIVFIVPAVDSDVWLKVLGYSAVPADWFASAA